MFTGYQFTDSIRFLSELEVERSIAGEGKVSEVDSEQAYIKWDATENLTAKAGLLLMPIGMVNKTHGPIPFLVPSAIMLRKILSQRLSGKQAQPITVKLSKVLLMPSWGTKGDTKQGTSPETIILDLHSGRLFGGAGVLFVDEAGLVLCIPPLTGLWARMSHQKLRKQ